MRGKNGLERFALLLRPEVFVPKDRVDLDVSEFSLNEHGGTRDALELHPDLLHHTLARDVFFDALGFHTVELHPSEREFQNGSQRLADVSLPAKGGIQDTQPLVHQ